MFERPGAGIFGYLKSQGRKPSELPLNVLRQFQEFEKIIAEQTSANNKQGGAVGAIKNAFMKVQMLGMAYSADAEFPALKNCLDDMMARFNGDEAFQDGIILYSWIFFDFPATKGGCPIGFKVAETLPDLKSFLDAALKTRLGIFEITNGNKAECHLKEFFTGNQVKLTQGLDTLGGSKKGSLILARPINVFGEHVIFGDISEFPASRRSTIEDMIWRKMNLFFHEENDVASYEKMMTLAGPYWFSIIAKDDKNDILSPDHYLLYY